MCVLYNVIYPIPDSSHNLSESYFARTTWYDLYYNNITCIQFSTSLLYAFEMTSSINVLLNPVPEAIQSGCFQLCRNTLLFPDLNNAVISPIATKHARYS